MSFGKNILSFTLMVMMMSSLMFSQKSADYDLGFKEGTMSAEDNKKWMAAGFCCAGYGVIAAYVVKPKADESSVVGKSADYAMGYKEGFKAEQKKYNTKNAWTGCGVAAGLACLFQLLTIVTAAV